MGARPVRVKPGASDTAFMLTLRFFCIVSARTFTKRPAAVFFFNSHCSPFSSAAKQSGVGDCQGRFNYVGTRLCFRIKRSPKAPWACGICRKKFLNCGAFFFFPFHIEKGGKMRAEDTLERSDLFFTLKKAAKKCAPKIGRAFLCLTEDCL